MGKRSRTKGASGEREVVALLKSYGVRAFRGGGAQAGGDRSKPDPHELADVVVKGSPFWIEVKRGRKVRVRDALRQAIADCPAGGVPVVFHRDDGDCWQITARAADVLEVVAELLERGEYIAPRDAPAEGADNA